MLNPSYTNQFQKDLKLMARRGKPLEKFKETAGRLISQEPLEPRLRNHKLTGNYKDRWECHLEPDWLPQFNDEVQHLGPAFAGGYPECYEPILQTPLVERT